MVPGGAGGGGGVGLELGAQQVVQDVHDGGDVPLGLPVGVLQRGVEGAAEGAAIDALAVVVHRLDDGSLAVGRVTPLPGALLGVALYCTVLYCTVLYCTVLYCTVLCCTVLYCTAHYKLDTAHCTLHYGFNIKQKETILVFFLSIFYPH